MKSLNRTTHPTTNHQFKVLQFGEGNFLRAFVDWIIHKSNKKLNTN